MQKNTKIQANSGFKQTLSLSKEDEDKVENIIWEFG